MRRSFLAAAAAISLGLTLVSFQPTNATAQPKPAPVWALNSQRTTLSGTFPGETGSVSLDAAQVDQMIETLAHMRAVMQPPRPMGSPAPGTTINVATAGRWLVQQDGNSVDLDILHPGYGWVGIELTRDGVEELRRSLLRATYRPPVRRHIHERR
ncbi:MAG TPA: hypothetical protein VMF05_12805 [Stellaceae bacterium]|nr:hypothetical protein [Stellaceae bacterium]